MKKKAGRPSKYKPEYAKQAEKLVTLGLRMVDLADFFNVDPDTISRWKKKYPEFGEAIKKGINNRKISLLKLMWQSAQNGNVSMQIFLAKNWLGYSDKINVEGQINDINVTVRRVKKIVKSRD